MTKEIVIAMLIQTITVAILVGGMAVVVVLMIRARYRAMIEYLDEYFCGVNACPGRQRVHTDRVTCDSPEMKSD